MTHLFLGFLTAHAFAPQVGLDKVQVTEAVYTDFDTNEAERRAGSGPYDVILIAVRSRLPFSPKDGATPVASEVFYAEAVVRPNSSPNLKLSFYGVPLQPGNNGGPVANKYFRTATRQMSPTGSGGQGSGPRWKVTASGEVPAYDSDAPGARRASYPQRFVFVPQAVTLSLYKDDKNNVYQYSTTDSVTLGAKLREDELRTGFRENTAAIYSQFLIGAPKQRQYVTAPVRAIAADGALNTFTFPGTAVYGGTGQPVSDRVCGIHRAYAFQTELMPSPKPGAPKQRWLFVTVDETGAWLDGSS